MVTMVGWLVIVVEDFGVVDGHPFTELVGVVIFVGDCRVPVRGVYIEVAN